MNEQERLRRKQIAKYALKVLLGAGTGYLAGKGLQYAGNNVRSVTLSNGKTYAPRKDALEILPGLGAAMGGIYSAVP